MKKNLLSFLRGLTSFLPKEKREFSLQRWLYFLEHGNESLAGEVVDHERALTVSAFYAAARIISETIGSLPFDLYEPQDGGGKRSATKEPQYGVMTRYPNDVNTPMEFWECLSGAAVVRGNSYAAKIIDGAGIVQQLIPIDPDRVQIWRIDGQLIYRIGPPVLGDSFLTVAQTPAAPVYLTRDEIMHFRIFSRNGITGMSPLDYAKEVLAAGMAQQKFQNRMYKHGARPSGILTTDTPLDENERKAAKEAWQEAQGGADNAWKTAFLGGGIKWQPIQMTADQMDYINSRNFNVAEVSRITRVPMHMLAELSRSTNNNIEQQSLEFLRDCIRPWMTRWEQTASRDTLTPQQQKRGLFYKFNEKALLRGDMNAQANSIRTYVSIGVMSINEARNDLDLNPIEGGDVHIVQINMTDLSKLGETPAVPGQIPGQNPQSDTNFGENPPESGLPGADGKDPSEGGSTEKDLTNLEDQRKKVAFLRQDQVHSAFRELISDAFDRIIRKEAAAVKRSAEKMDSQQFRTWLDTFYREEHREYCTQQLKPVLTRAARALESSRDIELHVSALVENHRLASIADIQRAYGTGVALRSAFMLDLFTIVDSWNERSEPFAARQIEILSKKEQENAA